MSNKQFYYDSIPDDTVQCYFFSTKADDKSGMEQLCNEINESLNGLCEGYIWHQEEFKVNFPSQQKPTDLPLHLFSKTYFGDNVEDEWFIVYLIFELTKIYPELVVKVVDTDGDFLLIEAANSLPDWINPETSLNRVYVYKNSLHIIPNNVLDFDTKLNTAEALCCIKKSPEKTIASGKIQQAIIDRIGSSPERYLNNVHYAMVTLPTEIATVLAIEPKLISPLVHSYCHFDTTNVKKCGSNTNIQNPNQNITIKLKFTKCLYAMLIHAKPPPGKKYFKKCERKKRDMIGDKLAFGFQMLMSQSPDDIFSSKKFLRLVEKLKESGYFQNNLEHSKQYNSLLENAKEFFSATETPINSYLCMKINDLISTDKFKEVKESLILKNTEAQGEESDSDDWLNIDPEHLNMLLSSRYGKQANFKADDVNSANILTDKLSNFLKETSDYEGIEQNCENNSDNIEFDADDFVSSVEKMLSIMSNTKNSSDNEYFDSDDGDAFDDLDLINKDMDNELLTKLNDTNVKNNESVVSNIIEGIKEEKGFLGPSSNVLCNIGINKTDILYDSDDD